MYNHIEYMMAIATNLKSIGHTEQKKRFFKSTGLASLDGLLASIGSANYPAVIAEDQGDQRFIDNTSDNILAIPYYTFYVVYPAKVNDDTSILEARQKALATAKKIVSRMLKNARERSTENGLKDLDFSSFRFLGIGPIGDNGHGTQVSFTLIQDPEIDYTTSDWLDE